MKLSGIDGFILGSFRDAKSSHTRAGTKTVELQYDVFDRWTGEKVLNGSGGLVSERHFVYDGNQILLQTDGDGNVTHRYLWAPVVDMILADETTAAALGTRSVIYSPFSGWHLPNPGGGGGIQGHWQGTGNLLNPGP